MNVQTFVSFRDELLKIAAVIPMVSHYEVTLDEDGKATGLSDTTQQLAYLPIGLKTMRSKIDEDLEKTSGWGDVATHAAEVGGLGILARPTVHKMQGKTVSKRSEHAHELVGLGVLAAERWNVDGLCWCRGGGGAMGRLLSWRRRGDGTLTGKCWCCGGSGSMKL